MPSEYQVGVILPPDIVTVEVGIEGLQGPQGSAGVGVPAGGSAFALLEKASATDYDTRWVTLDASSVGALASTGGTVTGLIVAQDVAMNVTTGSSDTVALNFSSGDAFVSRAVSGTAVSITGTGYAPGVTRTVRLTGGTAVASLSVPVDWKFVGTAAGTSLGTAVTVLVTATSFGSAATDVVAAFAKQP